MKNIIQILFITLLISCSNAKKGSYNENIIHIVSEGATLIENVDVFNGKDEEILKSVDVLISDGRIESIGNIDLKNIKGEYQRVDGEGKFLMPGFIDSHVHLASSGGAPWSAVRPNVEYNLKAYLYSGVTTVYELGGLASHAHKLNAKIDEGKLDGPSIYNTHVPITVKNSHPIPLAKVTAPFPLNRMVDLLIPTIEKPEDASKLIEKYTKQKIDYVKIICDQLPTGTNEMSFDLLKALIDEAHKKDLKVFVHIGSGLNAVNAIKVGADVLAHGVYRSALTDEQAKFIAESGVPIIYTLAGFENVYQISSGTFNASRMDSALLPKEILDPICKHNGLEFNHTPVMKDFARDVKDNRPHWRGNIEKLLKYKTKIVVGTDSALPGTYPGTTYIQEMKLLKEYGLSNFQILSGATYENARLFLDKPDFGLVDEGYKADLVLLKGNPLKDISQVEFIEVVWKKGKMYKREGNE